MPTDFKITETHVFLSQTQPYHDEIEFYVNFIINDSFILQYDGDSFFIPSSIAVSWKEKKESQENSFQNIKTDDLVETLNFPDDLDLVFIKETYSPKVFGDKKLLKLFSEI